LSTLIHRGKTCSLTPPIFYVAKSSLLKDRRFPFGILGNINVVGHRGIRIIQVQKRIPIKDLWNGWIVRSLQ